MNPNRGFEFPDNFEIFNEMNSNRDFDFPDDFETCYDDVDEMNPNDVVEFSLGFEIYVLQICACPSSVS